MNETDADEGVEPVNKADVRLSKIRCTNKMASFDERDYGESRKMLIKCTSRNSYFLECS